MMMAQEVPGDARDEDEDEDLHLSMFESPIWDFLEGLWSMERVP